MQEVYQAGLEQEEIDRAVQEQESLQLASYDTDPTDAADGRVPFTEFYDDFVPDLEVRSTCCCL
jgi:hypothetical protein